MVGDLIIRKCLYYTSIHPPYSIRVSAYTRICLTLKSNERLVPKDGLVLSHFSELNSVILSPKLLCLLYK
jgi:hypothetical protein